MKVLFTIWAKVGTEEQHRGTQKTAVLHPTKQLDGKNSSKYLHIKNNCVPLRYEN